MLNLYQQITSKYIKLDVGDKNGWTDYIDYIKLTDFDTSIVHGIDKFQRKFFVIKVITDDNNIYMQTFFQRYTDDYNLWMGCGHATDNIIITTGGLTTEQINLLKQLINGDVITCTKNIVETYNINDIFLNKSIKIKI